LNEERTLEAAVVRFLSQNIERMWKNICWQLIFNSGGISISSLDLAMKKPLVCPFYSLFYLSNYKIIFIINHLLIEISKYQNRQIFGI